MKSFIKSKTFWFGVGQVIFGVVGYVTEWIDKDMATSLFLTGLASIGLRFQTKEAII